MKVLQVEAERSPKEGEQPHVFEQNELDTCDVEGGPWFEQFSGVIENVSRA